MSLIKLARMNEDTIYAKSWAKEAEKYANPNDPKNLIPINNKAKKVTDRYANYAKYLKNKNIKRGIIAAAIASAVGGIGYAAYRKSKKE